jgi:hypothetical protein
MSTALTNAASSSLPDGLMAGLFPVVVAPWVGDA